MVPPGQWNMMDLKQLMDLLADHLALYYSSTSAPVSPTSNYQSRNNILRWISTLSIEQRQAALTTVDDSMVAILLQMHTCIQKHVHGGPDVSSQNSPPPLNSLSLVEDLAKHVDRFICVMDAISDGEFLRSKGSFVDSKWNWEELPWLRAK
ncbi:hypothetical protein KI387_040998, partial [Taxus chinensis]